MRHKKRMKLAALLACLTLAALFCVLLTACGKEEKAAPALPQEETSPAEPETAEMTPAERVSEVRIEENTATLNNNGTELILSARDNALFVKSFSTPAEGNRMQEDSAFTLPSSRKDEKGYGRFNWKFESLEACSGMEKGGETKGVRINYQDGDSSLSVICRFYVGVDGAFEFSTLLTNGAKSELLISPGSFASFRFRGGEDNALYAFAKESGAAEGFVQSNGALYGGSGSYCYPIRDKSLLNVWTSVNQNWNAGGFLPLAYMTSGNRGVYVGLEWTSGRILVAGNGSDYNVSVDMDEVSESKGKFETRLPAGSEFVFPNVYLGAFENGLEVGSNSFKNWFRACKAPKNLRNDANEPYTQMDMQSGLETHGVEAVKLDYGWWDPLNRGSCGNWNALEGSWQLRNGGIRSTLRRYGCMDLRSYAELAEERGISLTVYLLLHDTIKAPGQVTDEEGEFNSLTHPDWFSNRTIDYGMGASADLGNEECVEYLQNAMTAFMNDNKVTTWRSDFEPICLFSDKENRHTAGGSDVQYWCTVGFGELCGHLSENVDGFRYESCSSGGSMKDLYVATLASVFNVEDTANYLSARMAFYDSSYVIHPSQLQLPCNVDCAISGTMYFYPQIPFGDMLSPDFRKAMIDMEYRTQLLGAPMFSSWSGTVLEDELEHYTDLYKNKLRPLIRDGDLYHVLPRPDGINWDGVMYADADSQNELKGCVFLFKPSASAGETVSFRLSGLDAEKTYVLTCEDHADQNRSVSGSVLMGEGITFRIGDPIGSDIIWITED